MTISRLAHAALGAAALAAAGVAAAPMTAQAQEDTIRFGTTRIAPGFGRPEQGTASPSVYTLYPIYDSLTQVSPEGDVSGSLAESWKNIDPLTWEVTLKRGIRFHNGEELTARQVIGQFTYLTTNDEAVGQVAYSTNQNQAYVGSVERINDHKVRVTTTQPNPELPRQLAGFWIPETGARDDMGTEDFARAPVGTGPYMDATFSGGTDGSIDFVAFADAMRKPKVENLHIVALGEAASRVSGILSNEIDIAQGVPYDAIESLRGAGHQVDVATRPSVWGWRFMAVRESSPFHDKRVRQAANYAIDRESIAKNLLGGTTVPGSQCATRFTFGYNPDVKPYPYDPEKARELLDAAGYGDGFDTEVMVTVGSYPADNEVYQLAAQQLSAIGIRTKVTVITFSEWLDRWYGRKAGPEGGMGFPGMFSNPCHNFNAIPFDAYPNLSCKKELPSHCNQEELAKLDAAMAEFDVDKRRKLIQELMALNHENAPNLFFTELTDLTGLHKRVKGFKNTIQRFNFHEITLEN